MCSIVDCTANKIHHGFMMLRKTTDLLQLCLLWCLLFPAIGSLSLKPPAEEILSKHLCPNPVLSSTSKLTPSELSKILLLRLQQTNKQSNYFSRLIRPCSFTEDLSLSLLPLAAQSADLRNPNSTFIRIQSINLNTSPWNFSTPSGVAGQCSKFIFFRSWSDYGNGYPVMCGRESFDKYLGPYGHPMILYYHLRDEGISFPLFHPSYDPYPHTASSSSSLPGSSRRDHQHHQRNILEIRYLLIYYSLRNSEGKWTCRLQQYSINPMQEACSGAPYQCGEYECGELDVLYQKKMGGGQGDAGADFQQQRFILVKSKNQEKYRVRNFLRQKFVPIIFLVMLICAYKTYMKAGLRLHHDQMPMPVSETRLRRYNSQRHPSHHLQHHPLGRDPFQDIYVFGGSDDNNVPVGLHIPFEPSSPVGERGVADVGGRTLGDSALPDGKFLVHSTDSPPAYNELFPPSYNELFHSNGDSSATSGVNAADAAKNPKV